MTTPAVLLLLCTGVLPVLMDQPQSLVMRTMLRHQLNLASMGNRRYEAPAARVPEETTEQANPEELMKLNFVHLKWPKKVNLSVVISLIN